MFLSFQAAPETMSFTVSNVADV